MVDELPTEIARPGRFDGQRGHAVDELVGVLLPVVAVRGIRDGFGKGLPGSFGDALACASMRGLPTVVNASSTLRSGSFSATSFSRLCRRRSTEVRYLSERSAHIYSTAGRPTLE